MLLCCSGACWSLPWSLLLWSLLLWSLLLLCWSLRGLVDVVLAIPIFLIHCITEATIFVRVKVACVVEDAVCSVSASASGSLLQHSNSPAQTSGALLNCSQADPQVKPGCLIFDGA